jgi:uncharacterized SAM-binding protein YcdF (DUF218 family)/glycosyltransferase involved in cell wall biosynthesis
MLKNQNIICISSIDWDFVWQGHQEVMAHFARNNNRVLFIENTGVRSPGIRDISRIRKRIKNWFKGIHGIRKEMENLYIFSPLVLPLPYFRIARWINKHLILSILEKWIKVVDFSDPIVWTFLPTGLASDLIDSLNKKLVVYYCIADFEKLVKRPARIRKSETKILQGCDLVFAQGARLKEHCRRYNDNVSIFPFGVNIDRFNKTNVSKERPHDIENIKGKILGYAGGVHRHVDFELIRFLAERNPDWTLLFIGPIQTDISRVKGLSNVRFLEMRGHGELPNYVASFDVCLVPYLLNEYTETVYPTKMNEYLAMGKPVVATSLPEIIEFNKKYNNVIYVAKDREDFEDLSKKALDEKTPETTLGYEKVARENSWTIRIEKMSKLIAKELERKKREMERDWKKNLVGFYRVAKRRFFRVCGTLILLYLLLFKTPFIWFLASPLRIDDVPQKADVIVVFGGGVGETGSPGKSTIERPRYAVKLYKEGYAKKIIFSSGYTYIYNDADNMRLFAISAGVPKRDIILEQKADSTYENAMFTKDIMDRNNWDSMLLVSSLYNMRRAYFVYKKWGKDIRVFYTPVKESQFYDTSEGIRVEQIKAIVHEYLGIVYYLFKGYIR